MEFLPRYLMRIFLLSVFIVMPISGQIIAKTILQNVVSSAIDLTYKELSVPTTSKKEEIIVDNNLGCTCKPFSLCQTYESNPTGYLQIDISIGPCHSYLDVCCNDTLTSFSTSTHTDDLKKNVPEVIPNSPEIVSITSDDSSSNKDKTNELISPSSANIIISTSTSSELIETFESTSHESSDNIELSSPSSSDIVTSTSSSTNLIETFESTSHESSDNIELSSPSSPDIVTSTTSSTNFIENLESTSHESSDNIELSSPSSPDIVTSTTSSTDMIEKPELPNTESNSHLIETVTTTKPDVKKHHKCGLWNKDGVGFRVLNAVNGESNYAEYPAMVAILGEVTSKSGDSKLLYRCGGSLIKPNVVLTAAHCVIKKDQSTLVVRAGEWDLQTEKEMYAHQDRRISKVVTHKDYYAGGLFNDVALLFTEGPFDLQENIQTICLPEQGQNFDHSLCYSSGWGKDVIFNNYTIAKKTASGIEKELGHYQVSILKKVELPIIPNEKCEDDLKKTRLGPKFTLHKSFMCAGGQQGKDTCKGDGGSPLMCPSESDPSTLIQAGIVAWGIGCGNTFPGVYVDVAHFREWIDNEIIT